MRRVAQIMGLPVSLDIRGNNMPEVFEAVFSLLRGIDQQFSTFKPNSEVCQLQRGEIDLENISSEGQQVFAECMQWDDATDGYFSPYFSGTYNPTGYVKGWAIQQASELLHHIGVRDYCINAGGDILVCADNTTPWTIALQHPINPDAYIGTLSATHMAVATSGTYARGVHIMDPKSKSPATDILSVTVRGQHIAIADVLATAICAMGLDRGLQYMDGYPDYQALCILPDLSTRSTKGFL